MVNWWVLLVWCGQADHNLSSIFHPKGRDQFHILCKVPTHGIPQLGARINQTLPAARSMTLKSGNQVKKSGHHEGQKKKFHRWLEEILKQPLFKPPDYFWAVISLTDYFGQLLIKVLKQVFFNPWRKTI